MEDSVAFTGVVAAEPAISSIRTASEFGGFTSFSSGTYLEIFGASLSRTTRTWQSGDFTSAGRSAPSELDGVRVTVNGIPAFISYISPTQLNVLTPADAAIGMVEVKVTTPFSGMTAEFQIRKALVSPGFLLPRGFTAGGRQYAAAQFPDLVFVGPPNLVAGIPFRPAKPGDVITLYGLGFGEVSPFIAPGRIASGRTTLINDLDISFGSTAAAIVYNGLAPDLFSVYQVNVEVPQSLADGEYRVNATLRGVALQQPPFYIVVRR